MKTLLAMALLSAVPVAPVFAQMSAGEMRCADFAAMDRRAQMAAVSSMDRHMGSSDATSSQRVPFRKQGVAA